MPFSPRRSLAGAAGSMGTLVAIVAAATLLALPANAAPLTPAAPARMATNPDGSCSGPDGVTVVIDFQDLGGGIEVRCAADRPRSGFEALTQAGVAYETTVRFPGMLCRIAGKPADAGCYHAPPTNAYWSYWTATPGGRWSYADLGAGNRAPAPGTIEGWSFSKDRASNDKPPPRYLPGTPPTTTTTAPPATTTPPSPPGTGPRPRPGDNDPGTPDGSDRPGGSGGSGDTGGGGGSGGSTPTGDPGAETDDGRRTTTTTGSGTTAPDRSPSTTASASGTEPDRRPTSGDPDEQAVGPPINQGTVDLADDGRSSGSPVPAIGVGLALLALGGWRFRVLALRRRSDDASRA